jgi:hypothetical protein
MPNGQPDTARIATTAQPTSGTAPVAQRGRWPVLGSCEHGGKSRFKRAIEGVSHSCLVEDQDKAVVVDVINRERQLLQLRVRASVDAVEALLDGDFREIGASGRSWPRADTIKALTASARSMGGPIQDDDMDARRLSEDLVLLTYVSTAGDRRARRSSLWRRSDRQWRLLHHQGTLLS